MSLQTFPGRPGHRRSMAPSARRAGTSSRRPGGHGARRPRACHGGNPGDCHRPVAGLVLVQVSYRYRIYPSPGQQQALARVFGCARVVYNDCLRLRDACQAAGEKISDTEVQRRVITLAKLTPERAWLAQAPSVALVQAAKDARRAYRNWLDSLQVSGRAEDGAPEVSPQARPPVHPAHPQRVRLAPVAAVRSEGG